MGCGYRLYKIMLDEVLIDVNEYQIKEETF